MKTIFGFISFGLLVIAFSAGSAVAQNPCDDAAGKTALDAEFRKNWDGNLTQRKAAVNAGKQFLEKYGTCEDVKDFSEYLKTAIPTIEEGINAEGAKAARSAILARFDSGIKNKNYDEVYAAGNEFVAKYPNDPAMLNLIIPMGMIGLDLSYPPTKNYKYNDDTLKYAKMAIAELKAGKPGIKKNAQGVPVFGAFQYETTRENAISELTYTIGYITYYAKGNKKEALPYYYQASQLPGPFKTNPLVYATIGDYYYEDVSRLAKEVQEMLKASNNQDTPEIRAKVALLNGYAERAMDAYARAHSFAKNDAASKAYKDGLYNNLKALYNIRFAKQDGMDTFIAGLVAKPMPDPTTAVMPVADPEPATNTTTSSVTATPASPTAVKKAVAVKKN